MTLSTHNFSMSISTLPSIEPSKIVQQLTGFIQEKTGDQSVIIGLSGGIDSTLSCTLAVRALGADKVTALIIKNVRYPEEHLNLARVFAKQMGIQTIELDSTRLREAALVTLPVSQKIIEIATMDARITDLAIRTIAQQRNLIYLGTINNTERLTGWYPKGALFGDFCPIGGLLKVQIQEVARFLGLPKEIIQAVSGDASRICSGCGQLPEFKGISYHLLDQVLYLFEMHRLDGVKDLDKGVVARILERVHKVDHKNMVFCEYPVVNHVV